MLRQFTVLLVLLINVSIFSQAYESKWGVGIGGVYPRFFSVSGDGYSDNNNYGGFVSIERYFNEQVSLRVLANYIHMESNYTSVSSTSETHKLNQFAGNLDVLYKFLPCDLVSPYLVFGFGVTSFKNENSYSSDLDDNFWGYQTNIGLGVEWGLSNDLAIKTEANYRTASNNKIDGNYSINENSKGLLGGNGDTYGTFDLGLVWYFDLGNESKVCEKCPEGIREVLVRDTVYVDRVKEVEKIIYDTVYVEKPNLFGVNFKFDKYNLSPESYPILDHAVETLNQYPDMGILITGHTDSYGTNQYNDKLSENRVNTVYDYLISKGINSNRIEKSWYGEDKPIRDNKTDLNRAFNRRVEIKVLGK